MPSAPIARTLLIFGGTLSLAITYWLSPASRPVRAALEQALAWTAGGFLRWFDPSVHVAGSAVVIRGFAANVVPACTGIFTTTIFIAAVLALPCSGKKKLVGILLGIGGILAFNWIRIVSLLLIGGYMAEALNFMHLVFWRSLAIFFALFLWLAWARRALTPPSQPSGT